MSFDVIVLGSGPGGYVTAIRASQLGLKVAIVEKESLGGICLNWGCIPTKALLKNAKVFELVKNSKNYGIEIGEVTVNWGKMIKRSRDVAKRLSKGIEYLMKKNKIDYIPAHGKIIDNCFFAGMAVVPVMRSTSLMISSMESPVNHQGLE